MNARLASFCVVLGLLSGLAWWHFSAPSTQLSLTTLDSALPAWRSGASDAGQRSLSFNDGVTRAAPSVVSVYASSAPTLLASPDPARQRVRTTQGSGVIIDSNGFIVTNWHIVADADTINVSLADGRLYPATLIGHDSETDIAVLQIPRTELPALSIDDAPSLRVGDIVLAIGNPFGVGQTVTMGIVSATRRRVNGASPWQNFVQIDAAINPGNSGGALINPDGQLVGVNSAVFRRAQTANAQGPRAGAAGAVGAAAQGIGFAIPASLLAEVVPQIVAHGRVARGSLRVGAADLPEFPALARDLGTAAGAVITRTDYADDTASNLLQRGDVVTAVDGRAISNADSLLMEISFLAPRSTTRLSLVRDGVEMEMELVVSEQRPES